MQFCRILESNNATNREPLWLSSDMSVPSLVSRNCTMATLRCVEARVWR